MILSSQVPNIFQSVYQNQITESEQARLKLYWDLWYFYGNDEPQKKRYYKNLLSGGGDDAKRLYSDSTLNRIIFAPEDIIQKVLKRQSAGIYDDYPVYTIDGKMNDDLNNLLNQLNWAAKMKESFEKALFFNVVETYIRFNNKKLCLDILTPNQFLINVREYDYMEKSELFIASSRQNLTTKEFEVVYIVWNDEEHYLMDVKENRLPIENNENGLNPYGIIPAATLRIREGLDYWGEPDWDLFNAQQRIDIIRTNHNFTALFQNFPIWVAVNIDPKELTELSPNKILKIQNVPSDMQNPSLTSVKPDVDWEQMRNNIDYEIKDIMRSKGIPANSSSTETVAQSGAAKTIDEIEVQENRADAKNKLYYYEIDLLNRLRKVYNYHAADMKLTKLPEGEFDVQYSEEKPSETVADKNTRREMEKKYYIKSDLDFIMEDREVDEKEAMEILEKNKAANGTMEVEKLDADGNPIKETGGLIAE